MEAWAAAYAAHKTLKTVKMVQNGIRPEGIERLLRDGLSHCKEIETLDLQDNTFTLVGARMLAGLVPTWTKLEDLGVSDCLLTARGGVLLGEALQKNQTPDLKKLRLQYNEIDLSGLKELKQAIVDALPKLEALEMNGNKFSEEDPLIEELRELFSDRGFEGLDELDDMEEDSEDEDEDDSDDEEKEEEEKAEKVIKEADQAENQKVAQEKDKKVDDLADLLGSTSISK